MLNKKHLIKGISLFAVLPILAASGAVYATDNAGGEQPSPPPVAEEGTEVKPVDYSVDSILKKLKEAREEKEKKEEVKPVITVDKLMEKLNEMRGEDKETEKYLVRYFDEDGYEIKKSEKVTLDYLKEHYALPGYSLKASQRFGDKEIHLYYQTEDMYVSKYVDTKGNEIAPDEMSVLEPRTIYQFRGYKYVKQELSKHGKHRVTKFIYEKEKDKWDKAADKDNVPNTGAYSQVCLIKG